MTGTDAPRCLVCDGPPGKPIRPYRCHTRHGRAVFGDAWLARCDGCSLVQAMPAPVPEALRRYYEADYRRRGYAGSDVADPDAFPKDNLFYFNRGESIAELVASHLDDPPQRILDVGAGYGHVLHALGRRYPEAERVAVEPSAACARHLHGMEIEVREAPVGEVMSSLPDGSDGFDLVVMSHVLEHLLEPGRTLETLGPRLARRGSDPTPGGSRSTPGGWHPTPGGSTSDGPETATGGVLYVEVPNVPPDSLLEYPDHVWAPRFDEPHLTFFGRDSLCRLLRRAGFEVVFCDTAGPEYRRVSRLRFHLPHWRWFLQRLIPDRLFHALRRQRFTRRLRVQEREEEFYRYGGFRLWIRAIARWARP